jgi:hypothetical protein
MSFKWSVFALLLLNGCGTSAVITTRSGTPYDAKIGGGDSDAIYVKGPRGPERVSRSEIVDIDHPGNVAATIGGIVTAYGVANIAVGAPLCGDQGPAFCVGVFTPALIGVAVMGWGLSVYDASVTAASGDAPTEKQGSVFVVPTHQVAGQAKSPGLLVGGTF